jgi:hypothetical protein
MTIIYFANRFSMRRREKNIDAYTVKCASSINNVPREANDLIGLAGGMALDERLK